MSCPKNIKRGLFGIKYEGDCDNEPSYLEKMSSDWYVVVSQCKRCKCSSRDGFTQRDLVRKLGFLPYFGRSIFLDWSAMLIQKIKASK